MVMKANKFQGVVRGSRIADAHAAQCLDGDVVVARLGDVAALIGAEFAKAPACGHCGSEAIRKWGVATGMKRYTCKACERDLQRAHRRAVGHLQKREEWRVCRAIVDGLSLRKAAKRVGAHLETSFHWRHRVR